MTGFAAQWDCGATVTDQFQVRTMENISEEGIVDEMVETLWHPIPPYSPDFCDKKANLSLVLTKRSPLPVQEAHHGVVVGKKPLMEMPWCLL